MAACSDKGIEAGGLIVILCSQQILEWTYIIFKIKSIRERPLTWITNAVTSYLFSTKNDLPGVHLILVSF